MRGGTLPNVDLWSAGWTQDGVYYPPALMQVLLNNFKQFSSGKEPYHPVPLVLGHDLDQELLKTAAAALKETGVGAAGWLQSVTIKNQPDGPHLYGTFTDVPPFLAEWIRSKKFRRPSIEFYENFISRDGGRHGAAIARVTVTGAVPPRNKGLADLPLVRFADNPCGLRTIKFKKEGDSMDRASMIAALQAWGVDTAALGDAVPDEVVSSFYNAMMAAKGQAPASGPPGVVQNADPAPTVPPPPTPVSAPTPTAQPGQLPNSVTVKFAEIDNQFRTLTNALTTLTQAVNGVAANQQNAAKDGERAVIHAFCDNLSRAPHFKIPPAEVESEVLALLAMDQTQKVHTFAGGGVRVSARELRMKILEARPPQRRGEVMPAPGGSAGVNNPGGMSPERRAQLSSHTATGRAAAALAAKK